MFTYEITAQEPLVFRSGRPFGSGGKDGGQFPWPSSIAGCIRNIVFRKGIEALPERSRQEIAKSTLATASYGPILGATGADQMVSALVTGPSNAIYLRNGNPQETQIYRCLPEAPQANAGSNLLKGLLPVTLDANAPKGKPVNGPRFWSLVNLANWLAERPLQPNQASLDGPSVVTRTHVAIDAGPQTAAQGKLFQIDALEFRAGLGDDQVEYSLLLRTPEDFPDQACFLGGEGKVSRVRRVTSNDPLAVPQEINDYCKEIKTPSSLALCLLTPAVFHSGWIPAWLDSNLIGVIPDTAIQVRLRAAAVSGWQSVSGWDLLANQPRAARKAVEAGAVYWFDILSGDSNPQVSGMDVLNKLWLHSISDDKQDRMTGWGTSIAIPLNKSFN